MRVAYGSAEMILLVTICCFGLIFDPAIVMLVVIFRVGVIFCVVFVVLHFSINT